MFLMDSLGNDELVAVEDKLVSMKITDQIILKVVIQWPMQDFRSERHIASKSLPCGFARDYGSCNPDGSEV